MVWALGPGVSVLHNVGVGVWPSRAVSIGNGSGTCGVMARPVLFCGLSRRRRLGREVLALPVSTWNGEEAVTSVERRGGLYGQDSERKSRRKLWRHR